MNQYKFDKDLYSIADFSDIADQIDCNPIHQRLSRDDDHFTKSKGIIQTMLMGMDIGQITLHETPDGDFTYESIDGGHRKRAILAFLSNKFPVKIEDPLFEGELKSVYWKDFTDEQREKFRKINLTFCIYENLTGPQVGHIFRTLNTITKIEHQEMLNSYGNIPIANAVRETVRAISGRDIVFHKLFEVVTKRTAQSYTYWNGFDNTGLRQDEWVARIFYRYYVGGGVGESDVSHLETMYDDHQLNDPNDTTTVSHITKKVYALLNFVQRMAYRSDDIYGKGLTVTEANLFARLYLLIEAKHTQVNIKDDEDFFKTVIAAHLLLSDSKTKDPALLEPVEQFDKGRPAWSFYKAMMSRYKDHDAIVHALNMLLERIDLDTLIFIKDKKRTFTFDQKKRGLARQGFKSVVTGMTLKLKGSHADHDEPHSKGGKTDGDNLLMMEVKHNLAKGANTLEDYLDTLGIDK